MERVAPGRQTGAALLALILMIIAGSAWMLISNLNATAIQNQRDKHDARILAEAKEALISYAVTHSDLSAAGNYGFLPCPDIDELGSIKEGGSHGTCGSKYHNSLGRFPWRSLGLEPLKDSAGECLWYAVSGQYKHSAPSSRSDLLNSDSNGTFEIYASDGTTMLIGDAPEDRPVAVIIAPGAPIYDQDRENLDPDDVPNCGGNYDPIQYLDVENPASPGSGIENYGVGNEADGIDKLVLASDKDRSEFNDKIIYITRNDIWKEIKRRNDFPYDNDLDAENIFYDIDDTISSDIENLTYWIASCISDYGKNHGSNKSLPYPAPLNIDNDVDNGDYRDSSSYEELGEGYGSSGLHLVDGVPLFGRLPDQLSYSESVTGKAESLITGCDLPSSQIDDDLESKYKAMWHHWKDHFFYAVAAVFQPRPIAEWDTTAAPICLPFSSCLCNDGERCLRLVNKNGDYTSPDDMAAIVIFSGYPRGNQDRYSPPVDVDNDTGDTRKLADSYLDDTDAIPDVNVDNINNLLDCVNDEATPDNCDFVNLEFDTDRFNDVYYCINDNDGINYFEVSYCEIKN